MCDAEIRFPVWALYLLLVLFTHMVVQTGVTLMGFLVHSRNLATLHRWGNALACTSLWFFLVSFLWRFPEGGSRELHIALMLNVIAFAFSMILQEVAASGMEGIDRELTRPSTAVFSSTGASFSNALYILYWMLDGPPGGNTNLFMALQGSCLAAYWSPGLIVPIRVMLRARNE